MKESSKWTREELRKREEAKSSCSDQLNHDGPRPLTPEKIEDLHQDMKEVSAKMREELEKRGKTKRS